MDVGDSAPIKQHPYTVSPMKKELLEKEVQYMLKGKKEKFFWNDIIEESQSNWSSPCILVPKHDGMKNDPATFQGMVNKLVRINCEQLISFMLILMDAKLINEKSSKKAVPRG